MFPLNDFNFVACALATVSAAVGYRVSRGRARGANGTLENERTAGQSRFRFLHFQRRNSTAHPRASSVAVTEYDGTEPPTSECGTPLPVGQENPADETEEGSLKRKQRSVSPGNPDPAEPPAKRRKTPEPEPIAPKMEEISPQLHEAASTRPTQATVQAPGENGTRVAQCGSAPEPERDHNCPIAEPPCRSRPASPAPVPSSMPVSPPLPRSPALTQTPSWPSTPPAIIAAKPSSAFQAFSGTPSAFASVSVAFSQTGPVWSASTQDTATDTTPSDPLAALSYATSTQTVVTGEEDENVDAEVKGAKVFIKRGARDFCEGILGNVKLLKHKETDYERILFRREPVMKVSMNVRLRPIVRCTFDEGQGLLRVTLKELAEDTQQEQVVVYALKRGKASRTEFADFAKVVVEHAERLQEQPPVLA